MLHREDYDDKRAFARMGVDCPAIISVNGGSTTHQAVVKDLSATGMQLSSADVLQIGVEVMVEMTPEKTIVPPLKARAEVVRCDEADGSYQLGLKIMEMLPGL